MKKLYQKNELTFALIWIGLYVVLLSAADSLSGSFGIAKVVTAPLCVAMTAFLYLWLRRYGLLAKYGLQAFQGSKKKYLYFLPLVLLCSTNIWWGVRLNLSLVETGLYIVSMLCVGFLEEVIFRGFLFKALCKDNIKRAIIISSVTFGFGHIVNLLNGSAVGETLMQICYAIAIGFLFTIMFHKGKGLWPCILAHSVTNSLSILSNGENRPPWGDWASGIFLCAVSLGYAAYILKQEKQ